MKFNAVLVMLLPQLNQIKSCRNQNCGKTEAHRMSNRKWNLNNSIKKLNWEFSDEPYATSLLQSQGLFVNFANNLPQYLGGQYPETKSFHQLLNQQLDSFCVLDSACGLAPWPQIDVPGNSRNGRDLYAFTFFSRQHQWT